MSAAPRRPRSPQPGVAGQTEAAPARQCFYLIDDSQSADLESFRMALRAISDLSYNASEGEKGDVVTERMHLHALFEQLERRLGYIIAPGSNIRAAWLDPAVLTVGPA